LRPCSAGGRPRASGLHSTPDMGADFHSPAAIPPPDVGLWRRRGATVSSRRRRGRPVTCRPLLTHAGIRSRGAVGSVVHILRSRVSGSACCSGHTVHRSRPPVHARPLIQAGDKALGAVADAVRIPPQVSGSARDSGLSSTIQDAGECPASVPSRG